jgi:acyl-CoA thioester hydrolase
MAMLNPLEELSKFRFKINLKVRWSDMDEMRHVNNAVYLTYFEEARIHYFGEALKLDWNQVSFILAGAHIDYIKPMIFPNPAFAYMRVSKFGNKSFEMRYLVTSLVDGKEELSASGYTTLVMYDYQANQTMVMPESLKETIRNYETEKI